MKYILYTIFLKEKNYLSVNGSKLTNSVIEGKDLSWTDKGEVQGVEKENQVFSEVIRQLQFLKVERKC